VPGNRWRKESKSFQMSEITPTAEEVEIVEDVSDQKTESRAGKDERSSLLSRAERIRDELGIVDGQVTLTFLDDAI
jgi:hypothetical protein